MPTTNTFRLHRTNTVHQHGKEIARFRKTISIKKDVSWLSFELSIRDTGIICRRQTRFNCTHNKHPQVGAFYTIGRLNLVEYTALAASLGSRGWEPVRVPTIETLKRCTVGQVMTRNETTLYQSITAFHLL